MTAQTQTLADAARPDARQVDAALAFCSAHDFPLGVALIAHRWRDGAADDVVAALARYQNADGGFGNGLEVDIAATESNPFATRLAMQALLALRDRPDAANAMLGGIDRYLTSAQDDGGDFRFSDAVKAGSLAPWFAGWTYPNLNPAACLAGLASRLGIGQPPMFARVDAMVESIGDPEELRTGGFYEILPYAEYAPLLAQNGHAELLETTVEGITAQLQAGAYEDASHALDHALGGGPVIAERIPEPLLSREATRLLGEQQDDGGWPSPYNPAWRPWTTATAFVHLATLRDMSR
ncbi:MAG: hypothetical protein WBA46_03920 [Thermomicrobiales bacterium]